MKIIQHIAIYIVIFNILGAALTTPLIHLDFELRKDFISKVLCINRDRPMTTCGGQCYLDKQLKKAAKQQEENPKSGHRLQEISFFNQELKSILFCDSCYEKQLDFMAIQSTDRTVKFIGSIFRPPQSS